MAKAYLVAIDGSDHGWKAVDLATSLAKASRAGLLLLHVVPEGRMPEDFERWAEVEGVSREDMRARYHASRTYGDVVIQEAEERVRRKGIEQVTTEVAEGSPSTQIVARAKSVNAEMVFLGSRGLSDIGGLLVGSVSHKVMNLAPCTCVLVK